MLKLINWELASTESAPSPADASAAKVYGTELSTEAYRLLMEVLGTAATLRPGFARRVAARPRRADAPVLPDPDVRRRNERDPARHHRHGGARLPHAPLIRRIPNGFHHNRSLTTSAAWCRTITESVCTNEHQRELDSADTRFDRDLWAKLIDADVLSAAAPEALGGGIRAFRAGRRPRGTGPSTGSRPHLESAVLAAGALAKFDRPSCNRIGPAPQSPAARSSRSRSPATWVTVRCRLRLPSPAAPGTGFTGTCAQVAYGPVADAFLVPADTGSAPRSSWCPPPTPASPSPR